MSNCSGTVTSWASLQDAILKVGPGSSNWALLTSFNSSYTSEIEIAGTTVIQGNGTVLDAMGKGRFFNVKGGGSLTLQSLTLKNGKESVGHFLL